MAVCKNCGGKIKPNMEKLKVVLGTSAAIAVAACLLGTPMGWVGLIMAGGQNAYQVLRLKVLAMKECEQAGSYFECEDCGRDIGIGEALGL